MNIELFAGAAVLGIPLVALILGLVEWVRGLGLVGNALKVTSMVIGLFLGAGFQISQAGLPTTFAGWFSIVLYGLALGLSASGINDAAKRIAGN